MYSFLLIAVCICVVFSSSEFARACVAPPASWDWSDERLVACTSTIVIGEYNGTGFKVREVLRGKVLSKGKVLYVNSENDETVHADESDPENEVGINPDCSLSTGFKKGESYVVFHHSHHPKGYLKVKGKNDPWVAKIRRLSKVTPPGKKCEPITDVNY